MSSTVWCKFLPGLIVAAETAAVVGMAALWTEGRPVDAAKLLPLLLAIALPLAVWWSASQARRRWQGPANQLLAILPRIRSGDEPIESLNEIGGKLEPLALLCQELMRDLREEQLRNTQLEQEVHQRIANRTEALERRIGALRQQASRDGLTGLFNRRLLDAYLPEAVARCKLNKRQLCLLMLDVDYFKPLNDTLGHAAGDQMLKSLAQIIRSTIREGDAAFRCGGDEFVVVLEGCAMDAAKALADRLASLSDEFGRTFHVPHPPRVSIGIVSTSELKDPDAAGLSRAADAALYKVKAAHHAQPASGRRKQSA